MARTPEAQLVSLCMGDGAVPSRIAKVAPFLRDLPATQHAQKVLYPNGEKSWEHAARKLLLCVTKAGGEDEFNERSARFVRACLALDGTLSSYAQRMDNLANDPDFDYWKSRNSQNRHRDEAMGRLASRLMEIKFYPCERKITQLAARRALKWIEFIRSDYLELADEEEIKFFYDEVRRGLPAAVAYFERTDSNLDFAQRLQIIVTLVIDRPYRRLYDELKPRSIDLLAPPGEMLKQYSAMPADYSSDSVIVERTMAMIERIIFDIEEGDNWDNILQSTTVGGGDILGEHQLTRLHAYLERLAD